MMKKTWMEPKAQLTQFAANEYVNAVCFTRVSGSGFLFFNNDGDKVFDYNGKTTGNIIADWIASWFDDDYANSGAGNKLAYNANDRNSADFFNNVANYSDTQGYDQFISDKTLSYTKYEFDGSNVQLDENKYLFSDGWFVTDTVDSAKPVTIWGTYTKNSGLEALVNPGDWTLGAGVRTSRS